MAMVIVALMGEGCSNTEYTAGGEQNVKPKITDSLSGFLLLYNLTEYIILWHGAVRVWDEIAIDTGLTQRVRTALSSQVWNATTNRGQTAATTSTLGSWVITHYRVILQCPHNINLKYIKHMNGGSYKVNTRLQQCKYCEEKEIWPRSIYMYSRVKLHCSDSYSDS